MFLYIGGIPFWVASMRVPNPGEKPVYAMRPSNACLNMSRRAKRERFLHALSSNFRNKEGPMNLMVERADKLTVHHAPIIIADLACAVELLKLYPDSLVAYVDGKLFFSFESVCVEYWPSDQVVSLVFTTHFFLYRADRWCRERVGGKCDYWYDL